MHEVWRMFCQMKDWQDGFPHLMKLWQATLVIPCSTVSCERGFSKQNLIKEMKRNRLNIEHLDDLMRVSLNGPQIDQMQWDRVYEIWKDAKDRSEWTKAHGPTIHCHKVLRKFHTCSYNHLYIHSTSVAF